MRRTSIRFRLMMIMIGLATLPVITVTLIATHNTKVSVKNELIRANVSRMQWADQYLDELIQQVDSMFYTLQINDRLMAAVGDIDNASLKTQLGNQRTIQSTLTSAFYANSRKIDGLTLYIHSDRKAFSVDYATSGSLSTVNPMSDPWKRILGQPVNMYFKQSGTGIYAIHSINRFPDKKLLGAFSAKIEKEAWREVGSILQSEKQSLVYVINDEGEILPGSTMEEEPSELKSILAGIPTVDLDIKQMETSKYHIFIKRVGDGQLTLIKLIPLELMNESAKPTITAGFLTAGIFVIISLLLSIFVSLRISKPIVSLARTMSKVQIQNFKEKIVDGKDEIGLLQQCYNSMMQRIKELIEQEYQKEIELKNVQLLALQAQINPHFLNNTLHLIGGMALSNNVPEIYKITRVIAQLLRYSIRMDNSLVTLRDELEHMENYIFIQQRRFEDRCDINVDRDEEMLGTKLPRFILQPIVENAFEHGLQSKTGAWKLHIRMRRLRGKGIIMIKDDGIGIEEDQLKQLREELRAGTAIQGSSENPEEKSKRTGIGLKNVNARLKLQFGQVYGTRIYSNANIGTLVVVVIPL